MQPGAVVIGRVEWAGSGHWPARLVAGSGSVGKLDILVPDGDAWLYSGMVVSFYYEDTKIADVGIRRQIDGRTMYVD